MMIYFLLGIILGFLPGFHPNLLLNFDLSPSILKILFISSSITAIFAASFKIPNYASILQVYNEKIKFKQFLLAIILSFLILFLLTPFVKYLILFFNKNKILILLFLIFIVLKSSKLNFKYLLVFILAGIFGSLIFKTENPNLGMMVYFTTVFGLTSIFQKIEKKKKNFTIYSIFPAIFIALLPAITPQQAFSIFAISGSSLISSTIFLISSIYFASLSNNLINKGRIAFIERYGSFTLWELFIYSVITLLFLFLLTKLKFKINFNNKHNFFIIILILLFMISEKYFILILPSFSLYLLTSFFKVDKTSLLGFLLLPTILFYLRCVLLLC